MIKVLQIEGFQSHNSTEIELSKGLNVIIGSSDSGKSSVIRACKWLFQNRPQGDSFRNNKLKPKDECSVCAIFENDAYILRQKMKGLNGYLADDTEYKALRSDVPQDVQDLSLMKEVNLQSQHPNDQYFLLTDSPGQVAKKFNEVAGLAVMDKAMYVINSHVRDGKQHSKVNDNEIDDINIRLKKLDWVTDAVVEAKALDSIYDEVVTLDDQLDAMDELIVNIHDVGKYLKEFKYLDDAEIRIHDLSAYENKVNELINKKDTLESLLIDLKEVNSSIKTYKGITSASNALKSIITTTESIKTIKGSKQKLNDILKELKWKGIDIKECQLRISSHQYEFDKRIKTETCPICGRI